jgi:DNA-binding transcriptional MerR regulator
MFDVFDFLGIIHILSTWEEKDEPEPKKLDEEKLSDLKKEISNLVDREVMKRIKKNPKIHLLQELYNKILDLEEEIRDKIKREITDVS